MTEKTFLVRADTELQDHIECLENCELVELTPEEIKEIKFCIMMNGLSKEWSKQREDIKNSILKKLEVMR